MSKIKGKKIGLAIICASVCTAGFILISSLPTTSWYQDDLHSDVSIEGNVHGSYFESGTGSEENPFEIARPIQLYYLSWLQEMGYFNECDVTDEGVGLKQQYHFYLSKDLDMNVEIEGTMTMYEIPPIGTVNYPFVGSFDGKGHVIKNLHITNNSEDYTNDPYDPNGEGTYGPPYEILGMFGVVGTTNVDTNTNKVPCSTMTDEGVLETYSQEATFDPGQNVVGNFYLEDVVITAAKNTTIDNALVGVVAGFANAKIENVGIKSASLVFSSGISPVEDVVGADSTTLSKYLSIGYATDDYVRNINSNDYKVFDPKATAKTYVSSSSGTAWGGSIDMAKLIKRIFKSRYSTGNTENTVPAYPKYQTNVYNDGVLQGSDITYDNRAYSYLQGQNRKTCYYVSDKTAGADSAYDSNENIGSYYFIDQTSGSAHKAYVGGYSDIQDDCAKVVQDIFYSGSEETCYYVRSSTGTGNNYIGVSTAGAIVTNSTLANAVKWHYKNHALYGHAKVNKTTNYSGTNPANVGQEQIFYLNYSGGTYSIGTSNSTNWNLTNGELTVPGNPGYYIKNSANNNYLCSNAGFNGITNATSQENATVWDIQNFGSRDSGYITLKNNNNQNVYLRRGGNTNTTLSVGTSTSYATLYRTSTTATTTYLAFSYNSYYYYIYLNGTSWGIQRMSSKNTKPSNNLQLIYTDGSMTVPTTATTEKPFSISSTRIERSGQAGYIPLATIGDELATCPFDYNNGKIDVSNFYTSPMNTGYIIGGYYDKTNGGHSSFDTNNFGDVRISQYDKNYISTSYDWSAKDYKTLYTINDDAYNANGTEKSTPIEFDKYGVIKNTTTNLNFVKLSSALSNLDDILEKNTDYVNGIHFMDSSISMERTIRADKVLINQEYKTNYEMPEDAVDFNLKDKGYINFFAGNYHNDNNSFFALHKIERDQNDNIVSMKKIKYVFKNENDALADYIYLYEDEGDGYTWSDGVSRAVSKNSFTKSGETYSFIFDTKWIGYNPTLVPHSSSKQAIHERIYYFEVPVNAGEYALGSCEGACGGYLIYLDISAAAQTIQRKEVNELFKVETLDGEIPYGTQFVEDYADAVPITTTDEVTGEEIEVKTGIVRTAINDIDDLNSYYGTISTGASGTYTFERTGNNITSDPTTISSLTSNYIGEGVTFNGATMQKTQRTIRRITDYDYNTMTHMYVRQVTTIEIVGTGASAHNYATTSIEYNTTGFTDDYTMAAIYSYDWVGDGPDFTYGYYLHISASGNSGIEVLFNNVTNDDFWLTVEYLQDDFTLTCGANEETVETADVQAAIAANTALPKVQILETADTGDSDSWYVFTNPTQIAEFKYICEKDAKVTPTFTFSGYACLEALDPFPENEEAISITGGSYTYSFDLSGTDPTSTEDDEDTHFHIYYTADGTYILVAADGSEYIVFVEQE